jgi:type IV secretory pathway VirB10-like protein
MTKKIYRTGQGKMIDMGALILQNEKVRAVGNMGVNARGDLIDHGGRIIDTKVEQVQRQFERQTQPVQATPVQPFQQSQTMTESPAVPVMDPDEEAALKSLDEQFNAEIENVRPAPMPVSEDPIVEATTGMAAAIKKANNKKIDKE